MHQAPDGFSSLGSAVLQRLSTHFFCPRSSRAHRGGQPGRPGDAGATEHHQRAWRVLPSQFSGLPLESRKDRRVRVMCASHDPEREPGGSITSSGRQLQDCRPTLYPWPRRTPGRRARCARLKCLASQERLDAGAGSRPTTRRRPVFHAPWRRTCPGERSRGRATCAVVRGVPRLASKSAAPRGRPKATGEDN